MPRFTPDWEPDDLESSEFDVPEFRGVPSALADDDQESTGARTATAARSATAARASSRAAAGRNAGGRGAARARQPVFPDDELLDEDLLSIAELETWPEPDERPARRSPSRTPRRAGGSREAARETGGRNPARSSTARAAGPRGGSRNGKSGSARSSSKKIAPSTTPPRALNFEVVGVLCLAIGAVLLYNAVRPQADGFITRVIITALRGTFGLGAVVIPLLMCGLGVLLIVRRHHTNLRAFWRGIIVGLLVFLTAVHLTVPVGFEFQGPNTLYNHGGIIGGVLTWLLRRAVGEIGAIIVLIALSLVALLFLTEVSLSSLVTRVGGFVHRGAVNVRDKTGDAFRRGFTLEDFTQDEDEYDELDDPEPVSRAGRRKPRVLPAEILNDESLKSGRDKVVRRNSPFFKIDEREIEEEAAALASQALPPKKSTPTTAKTEAPVAEEEAPRIEIIDTPPPPSVVDGAAEETTVKPDDVVTVHHQPVENPTGADGEPLTPTEALEAQALASAGQGATPRPQRPQRVRRHFGDGPLMPEYFDDAVRSLDPPLMPDVAGVEDDIKQGVQSVQETLAAFKIDARVTDVKRGPVITRYEVQPAPGVRVATIANLDRDMARSLSAIAVRIEAPVPGKNVVGIEVPNKRVHLVRLRDVLELPEFLSAQSKLAFVLGKDIAGQPKWADLTKMPHMLVAGATNSGKSVCLNAIISSIITRAAPDEVKFSLIDPKRVELTLYRGIPHLYHPVVVEPKDAVKVLRGMIMEMDRRYKMFAQRGVRNIVSYNGKLEEDEAPLPYIVIVIDELADLMMTAAAEFEKLICRLAQLARATGIHLIVATQRPSVNVITGVIKANIPARVAFAVASQVDSRTILDAVGAERLIGSGDMLFDANNGGKATRIQGAYLSEEEVNRIVEVVKSSYADEPHEYGLDLEAMDDDDDSNDSKSGYASDEKRDDLYDEIKEFVLRHQEMSASMIQRKFEIGFPRAGRIVDQLERNGVLGPADGPKARKVIGPGRE